MQKTDTVPANSLSPAMSTGVKIGLIGGIIAFFIALQGMLQAFATRDIVSGLVSMSQILLLVTFFGAAYAAASRSGATSAWLVLALGAVAGFLSSVFLVILIAVGSVIRLGDMFINATPQLYDMLTFKQGLGAGSLLLVALATVFGLGAAVVYLLPSQVRRSVMYGLGTVVAFGLLQDLIKTTLQDFEFLKPVTNFVFESNGVSNEGAVALFLIVAIVSFAWGTWGGQVQKSYDRMPTNSQRAVRWSSYGLLFVLALSLPMLLGLYLSEVLDQVAVYLLMALGLNIVVGFAGLLDLGYVAFLAIGAYTVGILTSPEHATGVIHSWWLALPFGVLVATLAGVILGIPVLKMRGDYLAIVTLGFGEIVRLLAISDFLKPWEGGAQGIQGIPLPNLGPITFGPSNITVPLLGQIQWGVSQQFYYLFLAGCALVIFISMRVKNSRLGRAWMAVREDEDVAQAMGINLVTTKLMAFGLGASFGGLAGAIFASKLASVYPQNLTFLISANVVAVIILGGMGSIPGVIVGALALVGLPELLREVGDYRYLFYGAVLVIMMLTRPEGLLPEARRRLELEEKPAEEEAGVAPAQEPVVLKTTE